MVPGENCNSTGCSHFFPGSASHSVSICTSNSSLGLRTSPQGFSSSPICAIALGRSQMDDGENFLLAIASARRVSDLGALSCHPHFLVFHPDTAVLRTRSGYLPKVVSKFHLNEEIVVSGLPVAGPLCGRCIFECCPCIKDLHGLDQCHQ